jgi:hypothetical protein
MPELHDLLDRAVDPPAPLDLDGLGRRVAAHRRRRRRTTIGAAVVAVLLGGGAVVALTAARDERSTDVDVAVESTDDVLQPTDLGLGALGIGVSGAGSDWPDCTDADVEVVPAEPAGITLLPKDGGQPCALQLVMTMTFRDPATGEPLADVEPNPLRLPSGIIWGQHDQGQLTLGRIEAQLRLEPEAGLVQCDGIEHGELYKVTGETTFEGFGPSPDVTLEDICTPDDP